MIVATRELERTGAGARRVGESTAVPGSLSACVRSSSPRPCQTLLLSIETVEFISSSFSCDGVIDGRCWMTSAAAPATIAVASEVPLPRNSVGERNRSSRR